MKKLLYCVAAAALLWGGLSAAPLQSQETGGGDDIVAPSPPEMWRIDISLLEGKDQVAPLAEWSNLQGLLDRVKKHSEATLGCRISESGQVDLGLYVRATSLAASSYLRPETELQFYGDAYKRIEGGGQVVIKYACPIDGPVEIGAVATDAAERRILEDDLSQLEFVMIPRLQPSPKVPEDCFLVTSASLVPSRVFDGPSGSQGDQTVSDRQAAETGESPISFRGRKEALERLAREIDWLRRFASLKPRCGEADPNSFSNNQVQALRLTLLRILPEVDFIKLSAEFWNSVQTRVERLRQNDQNQIEELKNLSRGVATGK